MFHKKICFRFQVFFVSSLPVIVVLTAIKTLSKFTTFVAIASTQNFILVLFISGFKFQIF
ncbi:hypothetical protein BXU01_01325 [[Flexibacter] sp. ATCC 35103]|nr:hypothetical protein BXU01_01325 [[Flexibacter] sp. ATCC 35103]